MSKLYDVLSAVIDKVNCSIKTEPQALTDEQKAQARVNIGAASVIDVLAALPTWEGGSY